MRGKEYMKEWEWLLEGITYIYKENQ